MVKILGIILLFAGQLAHAALFSDDEARLAILDLRKTVESMRLEISQLQQQRVQQNNSSQQLLEGSVRIREDLDKLQKQIDQLGIALISSQTSMDKDRREVQQLRGELERFNYSYAELQKNLALLDKSVQDRVRKLEPQKVLLDGVEFNAELDEKRLFELALEYFRNSKYSESIYAFSELLHKYPRSGYAVQSQFWRANARYAIKDYKTSVDELRLFLQTYPNNSRAPEVLLTLANAYSEIKDLKASKKLLIELVDTYPQSESAKLAQERLRTLK
ncbi:MAG: outer membrane protein assembly factor BamD [Gammaproteobacteria bacterium]|nr:outer membrane protein assembly factor BamD [Gammaproteobacteria bacterium]